MNKAQIEYLRMNGLADMEALHAAPPSVRLGFANLAGRPAPEPEIESAPTITGAAQDFLGDRDPASLSKSDFELFDWLNSNEAFRKPVAATASTDLVTGIPAPSSRAAPKLDPVKLMGLSGPARLSVANDFDMLTAVRAGRFTADEDAIMLRLNSYLSAA